MLQSSIPSNFVFRSCSLLLHFTLIYPRFSIVVFPHAHLLSLSRRWQPLPTAIDTDALLSSNQISHNDLPIDHATQHEYQHQFNRSAYEVYLNVADNSVRLQPTSTSDADITPCRMDLYNARGFRGRSCRPCFLFQEQKESYHTVRKRNSVAHITLSCSHPTATRYL